MDYLNKLSCAVTLPRTVQPHVQGRSTGLAHDSSFDSDIDVSVILFLVSAIPVWGSFNEISSNSTRTSNSCTYLLVSINQNEINSNLFPFDSLMFTKRATGWWTEIYRLSFEIIGKLWCLSHRTLIKIPNRNHLSESGSSGSFACD